MFFFALRSGHCTVGALQHSHIDSLNYSSRHAVAEVFSVWGGSLTQCYSNWRCSYQQIDFWSHVIHNKQQFTHLIFNQIFFILSTTTLPVVSYPQRDLLLHLFCNDICCCISSATRYVVVFFIASISATRELLVIPKIHEWKGKCITDLVLHWRF